MMSEPGNPMSDSSRKKPIRRILVAVDASSHSLSALEAAAELAGDIDAELVAVFVEDENLLRLSELARSREVTLYSAERHHLDRRSVERMFSQMAARARELLHRVSQEQSIRSVSFRTARGQVARRLLEEADDADLVTLGTRGWTPGIRPGSTVRRLLREPEVPPVLVIREGLRLGTCPFAIHDGSAAGRKAIRLAAVLAEQNDARLTVLVSDEQGAEALQETAAEAEEILAEEGVGGAIRELSPERAVALDEFLRRRGCGVLVAPRPGPDEEDHRVQTLLSRADCPILLVS